MFSPSFDKVEDITWVQEDRTYAWPDRYCPRGHTVGRGFQCLTGVTQPKNRSHYGLPEVIRFERGFEFITPPKNRKMFVHWVLALMVESIEVVW